MRILIIGGHGTIGRRLVNHLNNEHEVIVAGRSKGDVIVDLTNSKSIRAMFEKTKNVDAIICAAGEARWANFDDLQEEDYYIGIRSKLMGQVNLVRIGLNYLNTGGSITLSTGILADDPVVKTSSAAMVNGAIHSFVQAAALEIEPGKRVNAVSLGVVQDAYEKYKDYFPGHNPIPMEKVVNIYLKSVFGNSSGKVYKYYDNA